MKRHLLPRLPFLKKAFLILGALSFAQSVFAQKITDEEDRKMFVKLIYEMESEAFKAEKGEFKTVSYNPGDYYKTVMSEAETESCLNLMKKTAKLGFSADRLYFTANILLSLNDEKRIGSVDVTRHENRLFYDKDPLEIVNAEGGGNNIGNDYYQVTLNYPVRGNLTDISKIHGSLIIKVDFLTGYDSVLLTGSDIGKKIILANETLEIVNIIDYVIVLKGNTKNVKMINFVSDQKVAKPLDGEEALMFSSHSTYKSCYESIVLKKMSLADFDKFMTIDRLNEMEHEEPYRVIKTIAPVKDKFILYRPVYTTHFLTVDH